MKTAVDYLIEELNGKGWGNISISIPEELIRQAKEREQIQIESAFLEGKMEMARVLNALPIIEVQKKGEDYYNERYGFQ